MQRHKQAVTEQIKRELEIFERYEPDLAKYFVDIYSRYYNAGIQVNAHVILESQILSRIKDAKKHTADTAEIKKIIIAGLKELKKGNY